MKWDCPIRPKRPSNNKSNRYSETHGPGHCGSFAPAQPMQQYHPRSYVAHTIDAANAADAENSLYVRFNL